MFWVYTIISSWHAIIDLYLSSITNLDICNIQKLLDLLNKLPRDNYKLLERLIRHLRRYSSQYKWRCLQMICDQFLLSFCMVLFIFIFFPFFFSGNLCSPVILIIPCIFCIESPINLMSTKWALKIWQWHLDHWLWHRQRSFQIVQIRLVTTVNISWFVK